MSMSWIRNAYGVPALRGGRIKYSGTRPATLGTITGAQGALLRIRLDGENRSRLFHPTWRLSYLSNDGDAHPCSPTPSVLRITLPMRRALERLASGQSLRGYANARTSTTLKARGLIQDSDTLTAAGAALIAPAAVPPGKPS